MFQIGDSLREARTRRGYSPADVQKAIRIRERYLTALEEERWDMLPGEAYTKGFLRTYSEYLGLNSQLYIDEYNARIARHVDDPPPFVPQASAELRTVRRGVLVTLVSILVVGAAVGGLAAWRLGGSPRHPAAPSPSAAGSVADAAPPPVVKPKTATTSPPPKAVVKPTPVLTSITASRGTCWILVRSNGPSGAILYEGTLQQGEAKHFRFVTKLWVRMGRPDALDITVAGHAVTGLPATPSNVVLTPAGSA
ncbi:MAG: helix-turn-helix domain-containing protein [Actinobacteria bacterium]|nr:helix-turn-helix domain-containing protein [Actinomycetota bacterium]